VTDPLLGDPFVVGPLSPEAAILSTPTVLPGVATAGRRFILAMLAATAMAARCGPPTDCPLQIRQVFLSGKTPQVIVKNRAAYPIGELVFHVAYQDLFGYYHEPTVPVDSIVQPGQRLTLSLQPISTSVEWETLQVFATCKPAPADSQ
jgi:hypothetical protein